MEFLNQNIVLYISVYILSSIPFGYLLALKFANVNIKNSGSGNIGATNVLRVVKETDPILAKKLGAITLFLDAIKGVVILVIAMILDVPENTLWAIAILSVIGHCYSIFLGFEGGKGVATAIGVLAIMVPYSALVGILVWAFSGKVLKISSVASLIALVALVISSYIFYPLMSHSPILIIASIVFYQHIPNITRLIYKEEKTI